MHILIDGYNLIRQSETFRRLDRIRLESGRHALMRSLADYKMRTGHRVTVVFDAREGGFETEERDRRGGVNCLYSRRGETADDLIKRMVADRKEEMVVVTSDREIAGFASRRGVAAMASPVFESRLRHAGEVPAGQQPSEKNGPSDEARDDDSVTGSRKKGPSRRLSKKQRLTRSIFRKV